MRSHAGQRQHAAPEPSARAPSSATPRRPLLQRKAGCACGGGCPSCRAAARTDPLEAQAEATAAAVMRSPAPAAPPALTPAEEEPARSPDEETEAALEPPAAALAAGQPLPPELDAFFAPRFARDLSAVRLHTAPAAAASARAFGARAYAWGNHIAFAPGEYRPDTASGRQLIAHEIAHVAQQGRAPMQGAATAQAPPRLQRECGPDEIGTVTGCEPGTGDIFGTPILFDPNCDTLTAEGEVVLREIGELVRGATVNVHGYASEEGPADFNHSLSCLRAYTVAMRLEAEYDTRLDRAYEHGPMPGERALRRSVCVAVAKEAPEPIRVPAPEPTPEPEPVTGEPEPDTPPAASDCGSFLGAVALAINANETVVGDFLECVCEFMKIGDTINSMIPFIPKAAETFIEGCDCICGIWDLMQLAWDIGTATTPCFDPWSLLTPIGIGRLAAFGVALVGDCGADLGDNLVNKLLTWLETEGGKGLFASGRFVTLLIHLGAFELTKKLVESLGEALVDILLYFTQNEITHGTPFPLDGCRSCLRLPYYLGFSDESSWCDRMNEAITPGLIRFPGAHGEPSDWGEAEGPNFGGAD